MSSGDIYQITTLGALVYNSDNSFKELDTVNGTANYSTPGEPGIFYTLNIGTKWIDNPCHLRQYNASSSEANTYQIDNCPQMTDKSGYIQILDVQEVGEGVFDMMFEVYPTIYKVESNNVTLAFPGNYSGLYLNEFSFKSWDRAILFGKQVPTNDSTNLQVIFLKLSDGSLIKNITVPGIDLQKLGPSKIQVLVTLGSTTSINIYDVESFVIEKTITVSGFKAVSAAWVRNKGFGLLDADGNVVYTDYNGNLKQITYNNFGSTKISSHIMSDEGFVLTTYNEAFGTQEIYYVDNEEKEQVFLGL